MRDVAAAAPLGCSFVKPPPTMIFPSPCSASARTVRSTFGLKAASREPSALNRARRLRVVAVDAPVGCAVVNVPPTTTLPSPWMTKASTPGASTPPRFGLKPASTLPSAFSRATRFRVVAAPPLGCSDVK